VLRFNPAFLTEFYGHMKLCSNIIKELISLPVFTGLTQLCKKSYRRIKMFVVCPCGQEFGVVESHDLNGVTYHEMLLNIVLPQLEHSPLNDNNKFITCQQEGLLCLMAYKFQTSSVTT